MVHFSAYGRGNATIGKKRKTCNIYGIDPLQIFLCFALDLVNDFSLNVTSANSRTKPQQKRRDFSVSLFHRSRFCFLPIKIDQVSLYIVWRHKFVVYLLSADHPETILSVTKHDCRAHICLCRTSRWLFWGWVREAIMAESSPYHLFGKKNKCNLGTYFKDHSYRLLYYDGQKDNWVTRRKILFPWKSFLGCLSNSRKDVIDHSDHSPCMTHTIDHCVVPHFSIFLINLVLNLFPLEL